MKMFAVAAMASMVLVGCYQYPDSVPKEEVASLSGDQAGEGWGIIIDGVFYEYDLSDAPRVALLVAAGIPQEVVDGMDDSARRRAKTNWQLARYDAKREVPSIRSTR